MGLIFRKSITILPGMKLNFGKNGTSVTVGAKGAHVTYGKDRETVSVGVPGTGVHYRKSVSTKKGKKPINTAYSNPQQMPMRTKSENMTWGFVFLIAGIITMLLAFLASLQIVGRIIIGGIAVIVFLMSYSFFTAKSIDDEDNEETKKAEVKTFKGFAIIIGLILLAVFGYLFFASFDWTWQSVSKNNIHIVYHFEWLKWLFYPIDVIGLAFGVFVTYVGFSIRSIETEKHPQKFRQK